MCFKYHMVAANDLMQTHTKEILMKKKSEYKLENSTFYG